VAAPYPTHEPFLVGGFVAPFSNLDVPLGGTLAVLITAQTPDQLSRVDA
jgi:hypothetical protein